MPGKPHICVCICTFKRPLSTIFLLEALEKQETGNLFGYSVNVVDNDRTGSGRQAVLCYAKESRMDIGYDIEPEQNIAMARNKAMARSKGDFVAFIDDDELPGPRWLLNLFKAITLFQTSGVLGPVLPRFVDPPPQWVLNGGFFSRPSHYTGYFLDWEISRTGNCLIRRDIVPEGQKWFDPAYGSGGEDRDFFKREISQGHVFVWCNEAPVHEAVPSERWRLSIMTKRALLRGKMTLLAEKQRPEKILASAGAAAAYSLSLPWLLILSPVIGLDLFMDYLVKDCDHIGKILALLKINLLREKYVA